MDKETGVFQREDNIFENPKLAALVKNKKTNTAHVPRMTDDIISITSLNARQVDFGDALGLDAQIAEAAFKVRLAFFRAGSH